MKLNNKLMALAATATLGFSSHTMALGTVAGTDITNAVTLDFKVSGATQVQLTDDTTFRVDNKIDMTLANNTPAANTTAPGATETYTFRLVNEGNKEQRFKLALENTSASTSTNITIPTVTYAITTQHNGTSTLATDEITVPVDGDVSFTAQFTFPTQTTAPANIADGDTFNILATATAIESDGTAITADVATDKNDAANIDGAELNVFAEDATTDSPIYNGVITVLASTDIATASLEDGSGAGGPGITVKVLNDPICNDDNTGYVVGTVYTCSATNAPATYTPKAIPGALVEYTITTVNVSTTTDADHLVYAHTLPATESTLANVAVTVDGTAQTGTYVYDTVTYNVNNSSATALQVNIETLPATETAVITFTAIVQ